MRSSDKYIRIKKKILTILEDIPDPAQVLLIAHSLGINLGLEYKYADLCPPEKDFDQDLMTDDALKKSLWRDREIDYEITTPMIPEDLSCIRSV